MLIYRSRKMKFLKFLGPSYDDVVYSDESSPMTDIYYQKKNKKLKLKT